ncbi:MAG: hypothetical protein ONB46_15605 [candidate division KSB1 bacterium]|nr:hypothetical protein [candidate division KSB1 bacterium]MDZ7367142.1 hypothetical protein [candidate division KSB1 bacterium]MDZ7405120.1 hypothetical protein [candidate division KSB1 bacterium]
MWNINFLKEFLKEMVLPIITGIIAFVGTLLWYLVFEGRTLSTFEKEDAAFGFLLGGVFSLLTFLLRLVHVRTKEIIEGEAVGKRVLDEIGTIQAYGALIRSHLKLPHQMQTIFTQLLLEIDRRGGGIAILKTDNKDYLDWLTLSLKHAQNSFCAILTFPYTPQWFFSDDPTSLQGGMLSSHQKLEYLSIVNEFAKKKKLKATRVIILEDSKVKESFAKLSKQQIQQFFQLHSNVKLYQVDPNSLLSLSKYHEFADPIREDYALIDGMLVLKKNSAFQLTVFLGNQNPGYATFFGADVLGKFIASSKKFPFRDTNDIIQAFIPEELTREIQLR